MIIPKAAGKFDKPSTYQPILDHLQVPKLEML